MKKILLLVVMLGMALSLSAEKVARPEAEKVARRVFTALTGNPAPVISNARTLEFQGVTTCYIFNFSKGGFVLLAADDASIPVLGCDDFSTIPEMITNPSTRSWIEGYSREIYEIVRNNLSNEITGKAWMAAGRERLKASPLDVMPLLTTTWDQGCYYNTLCPSDPAAAWACGHVYTGCVATAMAQVMKYHNFPPQGVGSHSYTHPDYGVQTANFGTTTYNWSSMPNNVTGTNNAVATIMFHAGVSVDMQYGVSGSGAFSDDVPSALINYFNYRPEAQIKYKNNYSTVTEWENLLRNDLNQGLPIYYSGYGSGGHAWVCDGYRNSDSKFHFNWGWSGSSNGWYAIGALNPGGSTFNDDNAAVIQVRPGNPNLIVRITHPVNNAVVGVGYPAEIEAVAVRGTPVTMKIFIDNIERVSVNNDTVSFTWSTSPADLGSHLVKAVAYTATDTGYYTINLNVAEWISQSSGFPAPSRGINYLSAADSNVVWGTAFDNNAPTAACSDFTRTVDGGNTWTPGTIPNTAGLASAMIFAMDADKAYVAMYRVSGNKPMGIYYTGDGGTTWAKQTTASFTNSASFPNCVHFFNSNDGWCMGDPISGEYEIYTTANGGTTWTQVSGSAIPNPVSGEFGVVGYYSAVNDTVWFGTNKGRVYRSTDKGHNWTVSTVSAFNGKYIKPTFRTGLHGLVQDKDAGTTGALCETFDGGNTWTPVTTTGTVYATDIAFVPGTENTWVSSGSTGNMGSSYSFNGGHAWTDFAGTSGSAYMQMTWVNNHCGFAGGVNTSATEDGIYKFIGVLMPPLPPPINLQASVTGHTVNLTWMPPISDNPSFTLEGYNMYRDGLKLNAAPITATTYADENVPSGQYTYCVRAKYSIGESGSECETVDVAVGVGEVEGNEITVYPNPGSGIFYINSPGPIQMITLTTLTGKIVLQREPVSGRIDLTGMHPGVYLLKVTTESTHTVKKIILN